MPQDNCEICLALLAAIERVRDNAKLQQVSGLNEKDFAIECDVAERALIACDYAHYVYYHGAKVSIIPPG